MLLHSNGMSNNLSFFFLYFHFSDMKHSPYAGMRSQLSSLYNTDSIVRPQRHLVCCDLAALTTDKCVNQLKSAQPGGATQETLTGSQLMFRQLAAAPHLFAVGLKTSVLSIRSQNCPKIGPALHFF